MFVDFNFIKNYFKGKTVAVVGSAPSITQNERGKIDSYDIVLRINNYKCGEAYTRFAGKKTDVHYAFYGSSIRKTRQELIEDGVKLCMAKCPNSQPISSDWHVRNNKPCGIDFRYIYRNRKKFWFCDTYIPTDKRFVELFEYLGKHIPTTGFSAIWDIKDCEPKELYITGFDFFRSKVHNVNEPWRCKNTDDPIGHAPEQEFKKLKELSKQYNFITVDKHLEGMGVVSEK